MKVSECTAKYIGWNEILQNLIYVFYSVQNDENVHQTEPNVFSRVQNTVGADRVFVRVVC